MMTEDRQELVQLRAMVSALEQLLEVQEQCVAEESDKARCLLEDLNRQNSEMKRLNESLRDEIAERKRMAAALRHERDISREYLDIAGVMILVCNVDQTVRMINRKGCEILGCPEGEVVGKHWSDRFIPEREKNRVDGIFARLVAGEPVEHAVNAVLANNGEERIIRWHHTVLKNGEGTITGTLSSGEDITERKQAEEALRQSEERHRALFESSRDAIMMLAPPTWKFTAANPSTVALFGASNEAEILAVEPWRLSPERQPDGQMSQDKAKEMIATALRDGSHFFEWTHARFSGEAFPATVLLSRMVLGGQTMLQAAVRDVSAQKRAEQALKEGEATLRAITDSAQDAVIMLNDVGRIAFWNPAAERILGRSARDALGSSVHDWLAPERFRQDVERGLRQFQKTGQGPIIGKTLELFALKADGTEFPVELSVAAVQLHDTWQAVGILRDISQRKAMEAQAGRLERMTAIGQLLGGIAHELKNPLFILSGHVQMLKEKLIPLRQESLVAGLQKIQGAVERVALITEQFLRLAQPVTAQQRRCAVQSLLQETLDMLGPELTRHRIRAVTAYAPDLPETWLAAGLVQEVFLNLVTNAIQSMAEAHGQGTLTVSAQLSAGGAQPSPPEERWIEARIQDDGAGIPPEIRSKIFEPFFTTKPAGKGTGLGLWIVRSNLMMLHGTVRVETDVGRGTTFIVRLPVAEEPTRGHGDAAKG